jgi:energy-coupling factor transporter transmembrane protein EcfT
MAHSRLAAIDPRVKLVWALALLAAGVVFTDPRTLGLLIGSIALVAAIGGVLGETIRRLRGLTVIIVVVSLIFGFVLPGEPIVTLPLGLTLTWDGLLAGFILALRIVVCAAPLTIVVMTTNNSDLIQALMALKLHPEVALMIVLALNAVVHGDTAGKALEIRGFARRQTRPEFEPLAADSYALLAFSLLLLLVALVSLIANYDLIAGLLPGLG